MCTYGHMTDYSKQSEAEIAMQAKQLYRIVGDYYSPLRMRYIPGLTLQQCYNIIKGMNDANKYKEA